MIDKIRWAAKTPRMRYRGLLPGIAIAIGLLFWPAVPSQATQAVLTAHINSALAAERAGDALRAAQEWSKVLLLAPDTAAAYFYRADNYDQLGLYSQALADASEYIPGSQGFGRLAAARDHLRGIGTD